MDRAGRIGERCCTGVEWAGAVHVNHAQNAGILLMHCNLFYVNIAVCLMCGAAHLDVLDVF